MDNIQKTMAIIRQLESRGYAQYEIKWLLRNRTLDTIIEMFNLKIED